MSLRTEFTMRAFTVFVAGVAGVWILTPVVWGATGGVVGGLFIARDPEYQQRMASFMKGKGLDSDVSRSEIRNA